MDGELLEEYFDIFLDDLLSLPPLRDVDHAIELILNAKPILKVSYCHFFAKKKNLNNI
jgi:hypothetical protein